MSAVAINEYAVLSDRHGAALVSRDGSVDWLCCPRFDSPSIFARLLGEDAGHWSVRAPGAVAVTRRYLDRTMVLETTYRTGGGTAVVVDALAMGTGNRGHDLGLGAPHLLLRRVSCTAGNVEVDVEFSPRPEYGLVIPLLDAVDGALMATGGPDVLVLSCPATLAVDRSSASGRLRLAQGQSVGFALHHSKRADMERARVWSQAEIAERLNDTVSAFAAAGAPAGPNRRGTSRDGNRARCGGRRTRRCGAAGERWPSADRREPECAQCGMTSGGVR